MLEYHKSRAVTLCAGVSGSGKSTFALRYLLNAPIRWRFVFDPEEEVSERLKVSPARTGIDLDGALHTGWIVFDPHTLFPGRLDEAFRFFCDWTFQLCEKLPGAKVLMVDEVWKYCNPLTIPQELATANQTGRKRELSLLLNTQQPQLINGSILNEVTEFIAFNMQFDKSLDLARRFGFDAAEIRALPMHEFISRNIRTGGELRGRLAF